jgi:hypothetical protein
MTAHHPAPAPGRPALLLYPSDTVAVALVDLPPGSVVELDCAGQPLTVTLRESIPAGHKLSIRAMRRGDRVLKYGQPIGRTTGPVEPGDWVHIHNVEPERARGDLDRGTEARIAKNTETPRTPRGRDT